MGRARGAEVLLRTAGGCAVTGAAVVQTAKMIGVYLIFACLFAEVAMRGRGRRWVSREVRRTVCLTFCCGFLVGAWCFEQAFADLPDVRRHRGGEALRWRRCVSRLRAAAEQDWRMAQEVSERMQATEAASARRRGKPMGKAA